MDIHKPNPWHGWREFLKEYAIIVAGVLTALAGEQAVETIHVAREARAAETLVREQYATNLAFATERLGVYSCTIRKLDELRSVVLATSTGPKLPLIGDFQGPPRRPFVWDKWEALVAGGFAEHLSEDRRLAYQRIYNTAQLTDTQERESAAWAELESMAGAARPIDPGTREELLQTIQLARLYARRMDEAARQVTTFAEPLSLPSPRLGVRIPTAAGHPICAALSVTR